MRNLFYSKNIERYRQHRTLRRHTSRDPYLVPCTWNLDDNFRPDSTQPHIFRIKPLRKGIRNYGNIEFYNTLRKFLKVKGVATEA